MGRPPLRNELPGPCVGGYDGGIGGGMASELIATNVFSCITTSRVYIYTDILASGGRSRRKLAWDYGVGGVGQGVSGQNFCIYISGINIGDT